MLCHPCKSHMTTHEITWIKSLHNGINGDRENQFCEFVIVYDCLKMCECVLEVKVWQNDVYASRYNISLCKTFVMFWLNFNYVHDLYLHAVSTIVLYYVFQFSRDLSFFLIKVYVTVKPEVHHLKLLYMGLVARKPVFEVSDKVRLKPACSATETR